ncbi:MAG TPA: KUP/HAK/KT family potassium transporter [Sphingomonas sp.]|nr:KUP/HAK/KT family potassium transporter [Sphingomonas sp.]
MLGALGVVFSDIGTSPIFAFRDVLGQMGDRIGGDGIMGVLSLAMWSLIIVVSIKYVVLLMRANNQGEGGVLALAAVARRVTGNRAKAAVVLGAIGAAMFYGDAIITPALSVLAASEGMRTIPGAGIGQGLALLLTMLIIVVLFVAQSRGWRRLSWLAGPICLAWFAVIALLGLWHLAGHPSVLWAFAPWYAIAFLAHHGIIGFFVLGAMILTVAGAEAVTAYMGRFGRAPIRFGWFAIVLPALALNYLGQGALALTTLDQASAAGVPFVNDNWFFLLAPPEARIPLILLALLTTVIASQAAIVGAYSLTQQASQLGLLPRLRVRRTVADGATRLYLPAVNWLMMVGVLVLLVQFGSSTAMAAAYGIAVTGTMTVTTALAYIVVRQRWRWGYRRALVLLAPFFALDCILLAANLLRVVEGGWVPLLVAGFIGLLIATWVRGRGIVHVFERRNSIPMAELAAALARRPPERVEGTAVFLTANPESAPGALLHNLKHNKVLHEQNLIVAVHTADRPFVPRDERIKATRIDDNFTTVTLTYGFMESPDVPRDLGLEADRKQVVADSTKVSFFIGRNTLKPSKDEGMPLWQDRIFMFLQRNASDPTDFLNIPPGKVLELGEQVTV